MKIFLLTLFLSFLANARVCEVFPSKIKVANSSFEKIEISPLAWDKGPAYDIQNSRVYFDVNLKKWCVAEIEKLENFDCEKTTVDLTEKGKLIGQIQINRDSRYFEVVSVGKGGRPDKVNAAKIRGYIESSSQRLRNDVTMGLQAFRAGKPIGQYSAYRSWQYDNKGNLKLERLNSPSKIVTTQSFAINGSDLVGHACGKTTVQKFNPRHRSDIQYATPSPSEQQR